MDIDDLSGNQVDSFINDFRLMVEEDDNKKLTLEQNKKRAMKDFLFRPHRIVIGGEVVEWFRKNNIDFKKFTW